MLSTLERSDLKNFQSNALTTSPVALEEPLGIMPELLEADIPSNSLHRASDGFRSIPEPNNTLGQAYNIGVLSGTRQFTDFVGTSDTNDYYRFSLNGTSNFTLNLSGLSADADVEVIRDGNGNLVRDAYEVIGSSSYGGTSPESINLRGLAADTYYIRVNPYGSANTNYTLNLTATSGLGVAPEPNNTLAQAHILNPATGTIPAYLNGTRQFSGWVGSTDTNDYYRFNLGTPSNINLALTGMGADADLQLLNSSGGLIQESSRGGSFDDSINREALAAGNYYVRVLRWSGDTNYRLSLSTVKPSNLLPVENNIGTLGAPRTFTGSVGSTNTADIYRFSLSGSRPFNLTLSGMSGSGVDADVRLIRDANNNGIVDSGDVIAGSTWGGTHPERISTSLGAGNYFVQVYQYSGNTPYTLNLNTARWTYLVYADGDNNLEGPAINDFLEAASVGSNNDVNIVFQLDRISGFDTRYGDWTGTRRGLVSTGATPTASWGTNLGELNMGAQNTLRDFANWAMSYYPAANTALVLWDHGGGWEDGICTDTTSSDDHLTLNEVSGALGSLNWNTNLVACDACLMGMTEFAHQIRNYASVLVASEESIPGYGYPYNTILADLRATPTMTPAQLGTTIVNRYGQFYGTSGNETLSAINLSSIGNLSNALSTFANTFRTSSTLNDRSRLETHRAASAEFGIDGGIHFYPAYRDLGTILSRVVNDTSMTGSIRTAAQTALNAYNSLIIRNYSAIAGRGTGLSINFQQRGTPVNSNYNSTNLRFAADTTWDEFLNWWRTA